MADKHLYPHGSQDQKHSQYCGGDYCYYMAAEGVWDFGFFEKCSHIKKRSIAVIR